MLRMNFNKLLLKSMDGLDDIDYGNIMPSLFRTTVCLEGVGLIQLFPVSSVLVNYDFTIP